MSCASASAAGGARRPYVELVVVEDGCIDATPSYLDEVSATPWGKRQLRWMHQDNAHELAMHQCGIAPARGPLVMAWQDDMFLRAGWLVPELVERSRRTTSSASSA